MNEKEIKKANRKAMPKFLLIMVISAIVGGGIGFLSARYGWNNLTGSLRADLPQCQKTVLNMGR